jgi:hypothetical protein
VASGTGIGEFFISLTVDAAEGALTVGDLVKRNGDSLEVATLGRNRASCSSSPSMLARVTGRRHARPRSGFAQFTMHTGLSAQELQKWQIVAQPVPRRPLTTSPQSVESITKKMADMETGGTGGGALGALQRLFISPFGPDGRPKQAFQILDEIHAKLGLIKTAGQQEAILGALGISPNLRETLLLSHDLFQKRADFVPGMTPEQEKQFDRLRQTFVEIHLLAKQIGNDIGAWVSGPIARVLEMLEVPLRGIPEWEKKGWKAWGDAFERAREADAKAKTLGKGGLDFEDSVLGQLIFGVQSKGTTPDLRLDALAPLALPTPAAAGNTTIHKSDTYHIQTNDPEAVKTVIERHWDEVLGRKTVDGADRQLNNGGY